MPCDTRLLVITPNWPNITLRRSSVMSGGKLLMYRLDSVSGLWDALFSGLSSAKDTLSVLPCISRPLKAARAFSASSCFSYSTKPYPRFAISLQLSILPIAENNAYIISRVISSDKELLAQTIKRRYSFHLSSYLQLELGAISMLAHMHIMVLMESMVSGHKFISIRERLADKLELLRFDPYKEHGQRHGEVGFCPERDVPVAGLQPVQRQDALPQQLAALVVQILGVQGVLTVGFLKALELDGLRVVDHGGEPGVHVGGGARVGHRGGRIVPRRRRFRHYLLWLRTTNSSTIIQKTR
ncbi:hypothetical protein MSG28_004463 [Choristoneura fumiferana]|uniref:Uncharacterized protein n=1 Tax=Choristoneura fumiferana TaxID=7141 RepID=A0ACC0K685_CHOFU|nr:hypothetical protein MSG28_004463 [Choristoneura fumiferana]